MVKIYSYFFLTLALLLGMAAQAQPTIDGDLSDPEYVVLATKQNSNAGFGSAIDISQISFHSDVINRVLYLAIQGNLNTGNANDGLGLWLNLSAPTGAAAGSDLGVSGGGAFHYLNGTDNTNLAYRADFEVDYMFALRSPNGSDMDLFGATQVGTPSVGYLGTANLSGSSTTTGSVDYDGDGNGGAITVALNNGGTANQGWEMAIPFDAIGASEFQTLQAFGMVVSNTAFFSDVTVPGDVSSGGNPGFNADFSTLSGGPYSSNSSSFPVVWLGFEGKVHQQGAWLQWKTAREWNNLGFAVERSTDGSHFQEIAFVSAASANEQGATYEFTDPDFRGESYYRLRQVDLDGQFNLSQAILLSSKGLRPQIRVYPHPLNEEFHWEVAADPTSLLQVQLLDIQGRRLLQSRGTAHELESQLADTFRGLSHGSYLLQTVFEGQRYSQRIQKQ